MQGFFSSDLMSSVSCPSISLKLSYIKLRKFLGGRETAWELLVLMASAFNPFSYGLQGALLCVVVPPSYRYTGVVSSIYLGFGAFVGLKSMKA